MHLKKSLLLLLFVSVGAPSLNAALLPAALPYLGMLTRGTRWLLGSTHSSSTPCLAEYRSTNAQENLLAERLTRLVHQLKIDPKHLKIRFVPDLKAEHGTECFIERGNEILIDPLLSEEPVGVQEFLLAHELVHYQYKHVPKLTALHFIIPLLQEGIVQGLANYCRSQPTASYQAIGSILQSPWSILPKWALAHLIYLAYARRAEKQADIFAVRSLGTAAGGIECCGIEGENKIPSVPFWTALKNKINAFHNAVESAHFFSIVKSLLFGYKYGVDHPSPAQRVEYLKKEEQNLSAL